MDLSKLVVIDQTFDLELVDPVSGDATGVTFTIRSAESDEVMEAERKNADKMLRNKSKVVTTGKIEANLLDAATASVSGWEWGENTLGDLDLSFSAKNVRAALDAHGWIYEQVEQAANDRANFTGN